MEIISFKKNWNNKLNNEYFTSYRLLSSKWKIGNHYQVYLNEKYMFNVEL